MGRVRSPKRRVRDDDFIVGLSSDILESSFYWRKHFKEFPLKSWASRFRGRRSIWWGWRVTLLNYLTGCTKKISSRRSFTVGRCRYGRAWRTWRTKGRWGRRRVCAASRVRDYRRSSIRRACDGFRSPHLGLHSQTNLSSWEIPQSRQDKFPFGFVLWHDSTQKSRINLHWSLRFQHGTRTNVVTLQEHVRFGIRWLLSCHRLFQNGFQIRSRLLVVSGDGRNRFVSMEVGVGKTARHVAWPDCCSSFWRKSFSEGWCRQASCVVRRLAKKQVDWSWGSRLDSHAVFARCVASARVYRQACTKTSKQSRWR